MKYYVTKWTIKDLFDTYKKGNLDLSPDYQRNFIWSINDQRYLISSIKRNNPIPNFFLLETAKGKYEMVDGQQRSRTILSFVDKQFTDEAGLLFDETVNKAMWGYEFPVTIITDTEGEEIYKFYAIVNKTGIHLNKPEVRKAEHYDTILLNLINEITNSKKFKLLKVFSDSSLKRMNDTEFVAELIVLIKKGHVDKKNYLDDYFKNDISKNDAAEIKRTFNEVLDNINFLNSHYPLAKSRFKQRNDFYTLFDFIWRNREIHHKTLLYFYETLLLIAEDIKPSQAECEPFKEYAINCVTQSNSKKARELRLKFLESLFLNQGKKPNAVQKSILKFYQLSVDNVEEVDSFLTIEREALNIKKGNVL
ncbi:MAG: DUF262 domain-containing protein [Bacteroidia bacterium]